jgi:hypothetical protein
MSHDPEACSGMIVLLQAELDGELGPIGEELELSHRLTCPECRAAFEVIEIVRAMRTRMTHHALPQKARQRLIGRLRMTQE